MYSWNQFYDFLKQRSTIFKYLKIGALVLRCTKSALVKQRLSKDIRKQQRLYWTALPKLMLIQGISSQEKGINTSLEII
jgi:hypothetical protein